MSLSQDRKHSPAFIAIVVILIIAMLVWAHFKSEATNMPTPANKHHLAPGIQPGPIGQPQKALVSRSSPNPGGLQNYRRD